jgi:hypothetical protein
VWAETAAAAATNRFGFASWGEQDAHFTAATAAGLEAQDVPPGLSIAGVSISGNELRLEISNPGNASFNVEGSATLLPGSWSAVAANQTGTVWTTPITGERMFFRLVSQ